MSERRVRNSARRRRGNDDSGAFSGVPRSTLVNFSVVEIREFERVVGDNPSCSSGVPVSIGWNHGKTFTMNLEDFEKARPPRRAQMDLVLTRGERHRLLVEWGASGQDVIEAIRMIIRVKNQRRQTVNNLGSYDRIEFFFEKAMRSAKKVICHSSANTAARKLQEDSERASTMKRMQTYGQATSFTANETLFTAQDTGTNGSRDPTPPCKEVSVHKDFETSSNSDAGDNGSHYDSSAAQKTAPSELPEEFPGRNIATTREVNRSRKPAADGDSEELKAKSKNATSDAYDDVDDMSNPQSHDHHQREPLKNRVPVQTVSATVDI